MEDNLRFQPVYLGRSSALPADALQQQPGGGGADLLIGLMDGDVVVGKKRLEGTGVKGDEPNAGSRMMVREILLRAQAHVDVGDKDVPNRRPDAQELSHETVSAGKVHISEEDDRLIRCNAVLFQGSSVPDVPLMGR